MLPAGSTERPCGCRSDQHLADFLPYRAAHPARPATNWSKGMELTAHHASASVEPDAWRQACPCSTEAQRTNPPGIVSQAGNLVVLSDSFCSGMGAMRTSLGSSFAQAVMCQSRCVVGEKPATNPPTGFGPDNRFVQRVPTWGAFVWRHTESGINHPRRSG